MSRIRLDIELSVNGEIHEIRVPAEETLLTTLRERLALTGAKRGCNQGVCGACTVLLDGLPARSCLALTANCGDRQITTVEGLAPPGQKTPLQQAFIIKGAVQCGFCSPGFLMALTALFRRSPAAGRSEIREAISGNLCRCSGYAKIVEAALSVSALAPGDPG